MEAKTDLLLNMSFFQYRSTSFNIVYNIIQHSSILKHIRSIHKNILKSTKYRFQTP